MNITQKKILKETLSYFVDTTNLSVENFILKVQFNMRKNKKVLDYPTWLAIKCFELLQEKDINLADCLEYKNLLIQMKLEKKGMNVTILWKKEIAALIESTGIQEFELFEISDKNSELNYIQLEKEVSCMEESTDAAINFFNTFDFDSNNKTLFNLLPEKIRFAINYNLPLFINMNPFLEHRYNIDNLLNLMRVYGINKKLVLNIFYGSLFRIIRFCEDYNLKKVRLGFFFPLNMFREETEYLEFYNYFKSYFTYNRGICFSPKSVGSRDKSDLIGYFIWDLNIGGKFKPVLVKEFKQATNETIIPSNMILLQGKRESLYNWVNNSVLLDKDVKKVPKYLNLQIKSDEEIDMASNVLGFQLYSKNVLISQKKLGIYSVPIGDFQYITNENLFKSVAAFVVRECIGEKTDKPISLSSPNVNIDGYQAWVADALSYFLFNTQNRMKSYREKDLILVNRMFPLSFHEVQGLIRDENIKNDIISNPPENQEFVETLKAVRLDMSEKGSEFFSFCVKKIRESLQGKIRENIGYKDSLVAWDASFYQIRGIEQLFDKQEEDKYNYLLSRLKSSLEEGLYKYGFLSSDVNIL